VVRRRGPGADRDRHRRTLITAHAEKEGIEISELALAQLPRAVVEDAAIVVRTDSAAATHEFCDELRAARIHFLMGYDLTAGVRAAILDLPEASWRPAIRQDGQTRDDAWVAELTDRLDLSAWPEGTRVIVRRERPHRGAQLSFSDHRAPLAGHVDRPARRPGLARTPAPRPRQRRGPRPQRQADRT
jgi:Transposase DDE domain group 1